MDDEYFHHNKNFLLTSQMQYAFMESTVNFEHSKNEPLSLSISEIIDSERRDHLNAKKVLFQKNLR